METLLDGSFSFIFLEVEPDGQYFNKCRSRSTSRLAYPTQWEWGPRNKGLVATCSCIVPPMQHRGDPAGQECDELQSWGLCMPSGLALPVSFLSSMSLMSVPAPAPDKRHLLSLQPCSQSFYGGKLSHLGLNISCFHVFNIRMCFCSASLALLGDSEVLLLSNDVSPSRIYL